jgi:exodeoxyribonuclease-3
MPRRAEPPYVETRPPPKPAGAVRIVTWNVNSVRLRIGLVAKLARATGADVICLQETKAENPVFPTKAIARLGYAHQHFHGDKGYNGVAILSRLPLSNQGRRLWAGKEDSRHVEATLPGAIDLHCVYVPAGGDIPDPAANPKFGHKLRFLEHLAEHWAGQPRGVRRILVGDLNVAPLENDVWSHKQLLDVVSHTPPETTRFARVIAAHGWIDAVRELHPEPQRLYTWWSYRNRDWRLSDRGRRLDHVWITPELRPALRGVHVLKGARDWRQGSDHVPVAVDLVP